jgi:hypothetical protein
MIAHRFTVVIDRSLCRLTVDLPHHWGANEVLGGQTQRCRAMTAFENNDLWPSTEKGSSAAAVDSATGVLC